MPTAEGTSAWKPLTPSRTWGKACGSLGSGSEGAARTLGPPGRAQPLPWGRVREGRGRSRS